MVDEILATAESAGAPYLDVEVRTILRRLAAAAATHGARPLRSRSAPERKAAALVWLVLKGNMQLSGRSRRTAGRLWDLFGVTECASLARDIAVKMGMFRASGPGEWYVLPCKEIVLGDARLLDSRARSCLIRVRDRTIELTEQLAAEHEAGKLVSPCGDGKVRVRGRELRFIRAMKELNLEGRAKVIVFLGEDIMDPEDVLALSVPDAHELVASLLCALDAPLTGPAG